jgi:hypothetical protein
MPEKLTLKDRGFISLMNAGWKATEAFRCIFPSTASPSSIPTLSSRKTAMLSEYINDKSMNIIGNVDSITQESITDENLEVLDKSAIIQRMRKIAETSNDPKIKLDAYQKIALIEGMKKEQSSNTEQDQIRYYLPLRCENCEFYLAKNT